MSIRQNRDWEIKEFEVTSESVYRSRRSLLKSMGMGGLIVGTAPLLAACEDNTPIVYENDPSAPLYPVKRNTRYVLDRPTTAENLATTYNNFYEFGSQKKIWRAAQALPLRPWLVEIDGLVEKPITIAIDDLLKKMPLEERLYRFRCVEAWSMAVPWSGFALKALVDFAKPLGSAKYLQMETFLNPKKAPGQRQGWYPWPYREGLTIAEATNELAFIATGLYGKPIPKQNGAPLRLAVPWKYGFKSVKSIARFTFTEHRPVTFWEKVQGQEYGFWANVNPKVSHRCWSQATERVLGKRGRVATQLFNGYGDYVADLYKGMEGERLYT
ncbi:MAG: protein-methionine-sulfoxide reductase catalytic subunit MsrP [Rhodospirillaceae bacterium]|nr:protein-methionine-sulfoxide reductase catalytic subunit MsrP [Rhodospirillaceae bacterium]|tara:strand:- start:45053 stop:46033 length:981 start_codon:yes stop_codon:yes gene_type:complete